MIKKLLSLFFICIQVFCHSQNTSNIQPTLPITSKDLYDSISSCISSQKDFKELENTFTIIRKSRKRLDSKYIPLLEQFALYAHELSYNSGEMKAYDFIGLQYRYDENYDSAFAYHTKSLEMAIKLKDSTQMFYNYNNLGQVFRMQDINTLALDYFHKALDISNAVGNLRSSSFTMNTIGATLVVQKDYPRAMKYFQRSNKIAEQRKDNRTLAYNYGNMGEVYLLTHQPDSAMYYFQISREMLVKLGSTKGMGVAEHLIGQAYFELKNYSKAIEKFKLALTYHLNDDNIRYQSLCNSYLGKIAINQDNFKLAEKYLEIAKTQAMEINSLKNLLEIYNAYVELYKKQNRYKKVYEALKQSHRYQDEIINESNNNNIHALEVSFETKEKEQKINLLSAENQIKNQRIILFLTLSIILLLILSLGILIYYRNKKKNIHKQEVLRQQLLRSQMNPHFLFNALGSIQNYMLKNNTKEAAGYLNNFASLTRAILNHSAVETITLEEEINALHNYIKLEQMRLLKSFTYTIEYDDTLETEFIEIPPMLIQPFVENAIKHGLKNKKDNGTLKIHIEDCKEYLIVNVTDNGNGFDINKKQINNHKSMAMTIFNQRISLLNKKYSKNAGFDIKSIEGKGTTLNLNIPIIEN